MMEGILNNDISNGLRSDYDQTPRGDFFQYIKRTYSYKLVKLLKFWINLRQDLASSIARHNFLLQCLREDVFPRNIINTCKRNYNNNFYSNIYSLLHKKLISSNKHKLLSYKYLTFLSILII